MTAQWYRLHPAFRPQPTDVAGGWWAVRDRDMPASWRAISDADQEDREQAFFTHVFDWFSQAGECRVQADLIAVPGGPYGQVFEAALTGPLIEKIVRSEPNRLTLTLNGDVRLEIHDGWTGVVSLLSEDDAESLLARAAS